MFQQAQTIDQAFRQVRNLSLCVVLFCFAVTGTSLLFSIKLIREANRKVYVVTKGQVLEAVASDRAENMEVEARDHIKTFHQYFFSLDPDEKTITKLNETTHLSI